MLVLPASKKAHAPNFSKIDMGANQHRSLVTFMVMNKKTFGIWHKFFHWIKLFMIFVIFFSIGRFGAEQSVDYLVCTGESLHGSNFVVILRHKLLLTFHGFKIGWADQKLWRFECWSCSGAIFSFKMVRNLQCWFFAFLSSDFCANCLICFLM